MILNDKFKIYKYSINFLWTCFPRIGPINEFQEDESRET